MARQPIEPPVAGGYRPREPSARVLVMRERSRLPGANDGKAWLDLQWDARNRAQDIRNAKRAQDYAIKARLLTV